MLLLHLRDRQCACDRFNAPHIEAIQQSFSGGDVQIVEVDVAPADDPLLQSISAWLPVTSIPAAIVIDRDDALAYVGPYSDGIGCLTGSGTFVERAIQRALSGPTHPQLNVLGMGCFCATPRAAINTPDFTEDSQA